MSFGANTQLPMARSRPGLARPSQLVRCHVRKPATSHIDRVSYRRKTHAHHPARHPRARARRRSQDVSVSMSAERVVPASPRSMRRSTSIRVIASQSGAPLRSRNLPPTCHPCASCPRTRLGRTLVHGYEVELSDMDGRIASQARGAAKERERESDPRFRRRERGSRRGAGAPFDQDPIYETLLQSRMQRDVR